MLIVTIATIEFALALYTMIGLETKVPIHVRFEWHSLSEPGRTHGASVLEDTIVDDFYVFT